MVIVAVVLIVLFIILITALLNKMFLSAVTSSLMKNKITSLIRQHITSYESPYKHSDSPAELGNKPLLLTKTNEIRYKKRQNTSCLLFR